MEFKIRKKDISLFLYWVFSAIVLRVFFIWIDPKLNIFPSNITPLVTSLIIALVQWFVIRKYIKESTQWGIFTFLGLSITASIVMGLSSQISAQFTENYNGTESYVYIFFGVIQAAEGLLVGLFQWFALRLVSPRALWWIPFTALANIVSVSANLYYLNLVTTSTTGGQISTAQDITRTILIGVLNALITGFALIWILQKTSEDDQFKFTDEEFKFADGQIEKEE